MNSNSLFSFVISVFVFVTLLSGCETYRASFAVTHTQATNIDSIYRLDLSHQGLTELTNEQLNPQLRMLDISGNSELDLFNALRKICALPKLSILKLNQLQLKEIPNVLSQCTQLTQLSLTHNPMLNLSNTIDVIAKLPLLFLDLSHNKLSQLPTNLNQLKLRDIRLSNNYLGNAETLITLSKMDNLYTIWLDNNHISQLPVEIGYLNKIGYLYLDENLLTSLPDEISNMHRLGGLWLGHNCFSSIPVVLAHAGVLMVYLNNNQINQIDDRFLQDEITLRGAVLDYNNFSDVQTTKLKQAFKHMFIYSDKNQHRSQSNKIKKCI